MLLGVARNAILSEFEHGNKDVTPQANCSTRIGALGASFVTLTMNAALRGCCGSLTPVRPLVDDVWRNARRSAFADPRFPPLRRSQIMACELNISVLSPLECLDAVSAHLLVQTLRPGVDGLLLRCNERQATFLPKVWEKLPDAEHFVHQLILKMGISPARWSSEIEAYRYITEEHAGPLACS